MRHIAKDSVFPALVAACLLVPGLASASFNFDPIISTLRPAGQGSSQTYTVVNDTDRKTPIQVAIVHRIVDENNQENQTETKDIDDLFQIYPSQLVLGPKEKRTVRVSWIGPPKPASELAFRIIAEEMPFSVDEKVYTKAVGEVTLASRYIGSLYVTPTGVAPRIHIVAAPTTDKPAKLGFTFENSGTLHQILKGISLKVTAASGDVTSEVSIPAEHLTATARMNLLAGRKLKYSVPWPQGLPIGPVKVSFALPKQ